MPWFQAIFTRKKILVVLGLAILLVSALILFLAFQTNQRSQPKEVKTPTTQKTESGFTSKEIWSITLGYLPSTNKVSFKEIKRLEGFSPDYTHQPQDGFLFRILDAQKNTLFQVRFGFPIGAVFVYGEPVLYDENTEVAYVLLVPYFEDSQLFQVFSPDGTLLAETPTPQTYNSPFQKVLAQAQSFDTLLENGPDSTKMDILFIGEGFPNQQALNDAVATTYPTLLATPPYSDFPNIYNIHTLLPSQPMTNCVSFFQQMLRNQFPTSQPACFNELSSNAASAPHDYIIVFFGDPSIAGGNVNAFVPPASLTELLPIVFLLKANTPMNRPLADSQCQPRTGFVYQTEKVFVHEFSHACGNLMDQYRYDCGGPTLPWPARLNCTANPNASTTEWQMYNLGQVFPGCTLASYYRATQNGSLMNTPEFNWNGPLYFDPVENDILARDCLSGYDNSAPVITPTPTPGTTTIPTIPPTIRPTTNPNITPTPIPFNCREELTTPAPGTGLQLKRLICNPI